MLNPFAVQLILFPVTIIFLFIGFTTLSYMEIRKYLKYFSISVVIFAGFLIGINSARSDSYDLIQDFVYTNMTMINGKNFDDLKTGSDADISITVYQSLDYPEDKQVIFRKSSYYNPILYKYLVFYVENDNGIAKVVDAKVNGDQIFINYKDYGFIFFNSNNSIQDEVIAMINGKIFNDLQCGEDADSSISVYQSLEFPKDKQILVSKHFYKETATLYVENDNGIAKVVDVKINK